MARQGVFSELWASSAQVLERRTTPWLQLRHLLAARLRQVAGEPLGPLLAALLMGRAVVELPLGRSTSTRAPEPNSWLDGDGTDFAGVNVRVVRESEMARGT